MRPKMFRDLRNRAGNFLTHAEMKNNLVSQKKFRKKILNKIIEEKEPEDIGKCGKLHSD